MTFRVLFLDALPNYIVATSKEWRKYIKLKNSTFLIRNLTLMFVFVCINHFVMKTHLNILKSVLLTINESFM